MALIRKFERVGMSRNVVHDEIGATYTSFTDAGRKYLQIDSYGRSGRDHPGKKSQTVQLDEDGARSLSQILKLEFGLH